MRGKEVISTNMQVARWCVDLAMGIVFLISVVTGLFKFTLLTVSPNRKKRE